MCYWHIYYTTKAIHKELVRVPLYRKGPSYEPNILIGIYQLNIYANIIYIYRINILNKAFVGGALVQIPMLKLLNICQKITKVKVKDLCEIPFIYYQP